VEFIGFIISLLALVYLFFKQQSYEHHRQAQSQDFKNEEVDEDDDLKEFMKAIDRETAARVATQHLPPRPPQIVKQIKKPSSTSFEEYRLASQIEKRQLKSSLENRHLKSKIAQKLEERTLPQIAQPHSHVRDWEETAPSKARIVLGRLSNRQDLIIYQEIIDKPKSMRPPL
jgi:hypothetical protein